MKSPVVTVCMGRLGCPIQTVFPDSPLGPGPWNADSDIVEDVLEGGWGDSGSSGSWAETIPWAETLEGRFLGFRLSAVWIARATSLGVAGLYPRPLYR